jgi:hypothetical protein
MTARYASTICRIASPVGAQWYTARSSVSALCACALGRPSSERESDVRPEMLQQPQQQDVQTVQQQQAGRAECRWAIYSCTESENRALKIGRRLYSTRNGVRRVKIPLPWWAAHCRISWQAVSRLWDVALGGLWDCFAQFLRPVPVRHACSSYSHQSCRYRSRSSELSHTVVVARASCALSCLFRFITLFTIFQ